VSETGQDHVEEIALGLARRIAEIRRAEEQLAAFAWDERDPGTDVSAAESGARHLLLRALHVATESGMYHLLERLVRDGDVALAELA
jgi:hypothetical protein